MWIDPDSLEDMKKVDYKLYKRMWEYQKRENLLLSAMGVFAIGIILLAVIFGKL
jgi:hypothetical protein